MAQRTVALCDDKYIGIESIYTVVNGRQINIPDKLKWLRSKSQNNELFCPCGCGANLVLVAGDKNLREQHFRIKDADAFPGCHVVTEGKTSVDSKIVLKCWLDDNLNADDLETRVPISAIADSTRKYEFSFISRNNRIALNYCHDRVNLSDEKLQILADNANGISIIHVVDYLNGGSEGQYPEGLMKVQKRQGYCLLLATDESDYDKANLIAVFYEQDLDGFWRENIISTGSLKEYRIADDGEIVFRNEKLLTLLSRTRQTFAEQLEAEKVRRKEAQKQREEHLKQLQIEAEKRREEQKKREEELAAIRKQQEEEYAKRRAEEAEKRRAEEARIAEEKRLRAEDFKRNIESNFEQQDTQVRDAEGNRWIKCEFCGKIAMESEFSSYGGPGHINLGTCKECSSNNPKAKPVYKSSEALSKKSYDPTICPDCGCKLVEKNGRNGRFIGCTGFPKCRYTRSINNK